MVGDGRRTVVDCSRGTRAYEQRAAIYCQSVPQGQTSADDQNSRGRARSRYATELAEETAARLRSRVRSRCIAGVEIDLWTLRGLIAST